MGFNSVIFVNNDCVGSIKKNPEEFWKQAWHALNGGEGPLPCEFGVGWHVNGATAVWNEHANVTGLIVSCNGGVHRKPEDQVDLLREAAEKLGYTLTKKRAKRTPPFLSKEEAAELRREDEEPDLKIHLSGNGGN